MRGIFHPQGAPGLSARLMEKFIIFLYYLSYYSYHKFHFGIQMCTVRYTIELNTFRIDDKDLTTK